MNKKKFLELDGFAAANSLPIEIWDGDIVFIEYDCVFEGTLVHMDNAVCIKNLPKGQKKQKEYVLRFLKARLTELGFIGFAESIVEVTSIQIFKDDLWKMVSKGK